jgi:hypothetical protein
MGAQAPHDIGGDVAVNALEAQSDTRVPEALKGWKLFFDRPHEEAG